MAGIGSALLKGLSTAAKITGAVARSPVSVPLSLSRGIKNSLKSVIEDPFDYKRLPFWSLGGGAAATTYAYGPEILSDLTGTKPYAPDRLGKHAIRNAEKVVKGDFGGIKGLANTMADYLDGRGTDKISASDALTQGTRSAISSGFEWLGANPIDGVDIDGNPIGYKLTKNKDGKDDYYINGSDILNRYNLFRQKQLTKDYAKLKWNWLLDTISPKNWLNILLTPTTFFNDSFKYLNNIDSLIAKPPKADVLPDDINDKLRKQYGDKYREVEQKKRIQEEKKPIKKESMMKNDTNIEKSAFLDKLFKPVISPLLKTVIGTSIAVPGSIMGVKATKELINNWGEPSIISAGTNPMGALLDAASSDMTPANAKAWKGAQPANLRKSIETLTGVGSEVEDLKNTVKEYKDILPSPTMAKALMYGAPIAAGGTYLAGKYLSRPQETNTINNIASSPVLASLIGAAGGALGGGALSKNFVVRKKGESDEDYEKRKRIRMILGGLIGGGALGTAGYFAGKQR